MVRALLVDNYDSFTYNLYALLAAVNGTEPTVIRNDSPWDAIDFDRFDNIVISPGPGSPTEVGDFGISARIIAEADRPLLGVCLGHQGLVFDVWGAHPERPRTRARAAVDDCAHRRRPVPRTLSPCGGALPLACGHRPARRAGSHRPHDRRLDHGGAPPEPTDVGSAVSSRVDRQRARSRNPDELPQQHTGGFPTPPSGLAPASGLVTPVRRGLAAPRQRRLEWRKIDHHPRPDQVYALFDRGQGAFWLDGSARSEHGSRFTIIGDGSGPHGHRVSYDVGTSTVRLHRPGLPVEHLRVSVFDYLKRQLHTRAAEPDPALPFDSSSASWAT